LVTWATPSSTLNNVSKAKHLAPNTNYHFFKNGIRPEWEDPSNAKGGKFVITIPRVKTSDVIDEYWTNLVSLYKYIYSLFITFLNDIILAYGHHW
jgi:hypothetical protein